MDAHTLALTGCLCIIIALSVVIKKNMLSDQQQTWLYLECGSALKVSVLKHQDNKLQLIWHILNRKYESIHACSTTIQGV